MNPIASERKAQECPICLHEDVVDKVTLACSHIFHVDCLDSWLFAREHLENCPLCRRSVEVLDPKNMKAFALMRLSIDEMPGQVMPKLVRAKMLYSIRSFDKALVDVNSALRLDPTNQFAHTLRTKIYYQHFAAIEELD